MFRAKTVKTGQLCYGYWCKIQSKHYMILDDAEYRYRGVFTDDTVTGFVEIDPLTLAMDTTVKDKHGKPIYGSFVVDGKMSEGGDIYAGEKWIPLFYFRGSGKRQERYTRAGHGNHEPTTYQCVYVLKTHTGFCPGFEFHEIGGNDIKNYSDRWEIIGPAEGGE